MALLFLLCSTCSTFRQGGATAPAAAGESPAASAPASGAALPSDRPEVSAFASVPSAPPVHDSSFRLPAPADLPTPALPAGDVVPSMPEPQVASAGSPARPHARSVGAGEAIVPTPLVQLAAPTALAREHSLRGPDSAPAHPGSLTSVPPVGAAGPAAAESMAAGTTTRPLARPSEAASPGGPAQAQAAPSRAQAAASPPAAQAPPRGAVSPGRAQGVVPSPSRGPAQPAPAAAQSPPGPPAVSAPSRGGATAAPPAQQAAASPPGAAAGGTSPRTIRRTVYARVGDDITIALDGGGWTFTGGGAAGDTWKQGVSYESRTTDSSGTTFTFKAAALGKWGLDFQQQNSTTGQNRMETIDVEVLTPQEFTRALAARRASSNGHGGAVPAGSLAAADWLFKEGKYGEALDAYVKAWSPGEPALTDKIAELAYRIGRYREARDYWQKNFGLSGGYGELAVVGLMKTATAEHDYPELRALYDNVRALRRISDPSALLAAGRYLFESKQWEVALRYLEEYLRRYNGENGADLADYLIGRIYAGDTPMQNARKALEFYREIVDHYPTSSYYELARANIIYLRRQFFEIR